MDEQRVQQLLLEELHSQVHNADFSLQQLTASLDDLHAARGADDEASLEEARRRVWFYLDGALAAMTHVANLLWPSSGAQDPDTPARGEALRALMDVDETDALGIRTVRNGFEHFDERVDRWARTSRESNFIDHALAPSSHFPGTRTEDIARLFDPVSGEVIVFGKTCNLRSADRELQGLHNRLKAIAPQELL